MRGDREEGKRRNGRLSSQNRKRSGRKKAEKKGKMLKRREPKGERSQASTCGTAVGAKQGRTKGNKQKAKYTEPERWHGKPGREQGEKPGKRERNRSTGEASCEARTGR